MELSVKTLKVAGIEVLIAITLYIAGRYTMKKKAEKEGKAPIKSEDLPNSGSGIPKGWTPSGIAERLYIALKGWSFGFLYAKNLRLYIELNALTNDQFVAVFKAYNRAYDKNLREDIAREWSAYGRETHQVEQIILDRAERLEL